MTTRIGIGGGWATFCVALGVLLGVSGCAQLDRIGITGPSAAESDPIALVVIDPPTFCSDLVQTKSDVVVVRPDYQTVISNDCGDNSDLGNAAVFWAVTYREATPEDRLAAGTAADEAVAPVSGEKKMPDEITVRAEQRFSARRGIGDSARPAKLKELQASATMKDLLSVAKASDRPIRVIGYFETVGDRTLAQQRAKRVANWLTAHGIDTDRIQLEVNGADMPNEQNTVGAQITIAVAGKKPVN